MNRFLYLLLFLFIFNAPVVSGQDDLQQMLEDWAGHPALKGAGIGLTLLDANTGKLLAGVNANQALSPASSLKVLTTAAVLDLLGNEYQYETRLTYTGTIIDGVLDGDIWIIGGGDPSLGGSRFGEDDMPAVLDKWLNMITAAGIKEIKGAIVGDGSYFSGPRSGRGWPWQDVGNYYGAGVWGLNLRENLFHLDFQLNPDQQRAPRLMGHRPLVPHLTLINELTTGDANSGDQAYLYGGPYNYNRFIRGSLPAGNRGFTIKGSIPDAPYFAAYHLKEHLKKAGIACDKATTWIDHPSAKGVKKNLGVIFSNPLKDLVEAANHESINLYCEAFLRSLSRSERSESGGLEQLKKWMVTLAIPQDNFLLMDGSGLSPQNRISAYALAAAVQKGIQNKAYRASLPVGNQDGTAQYLFRGEPNAHRIRVKSGYIEGVRSYTGMASSVNGREFTFCFLLNNFSCSQAQARGLLEELMIGLTTIE